MIRFSLGAPLAYILKIGITFLLTEIASIHYFLSYVVTYVLIVLFAYFYNNYITFRKNPAYRSFRNFIIAYLFFIILDLFLVKTLTDFYQINYLLSITLVTITLFFLKFFVYHKKVFV